MFRGRGDTGAGTDGWETLEARQAPNSNISRMAFLCVLYYICLWLNMFLLSSRFLSKINQWLSSQR